MNGQGLLQERENYSQLRVTALQKELANIPELTSFPDLVIFGAGSYGRLEASEHSDIDMFFLNTGDKENVLEPKTSQIKLFAKVIDIVNKMGFPKFSNDGQYLEILHMQDMIHKLGGREDDYENHFTSRMLLLLESKWLAREGLYKKTIEEIVNSYFIDYPKHKDNFKPVFLMNDIMRYWKTLCLNYENKRRGRDEASIQEVKQRVKNFKLKFSRMTTCFATIGYLSCQLESVTENDVNKLVQLTPRQRLQHIVTLYPKAEPKVAEILKGYSWFLGMTALPTNKLEQHFNDHAGRQDAFDRANAYGDKMFELLQLIDSEFHVFRYLVI